MNRKIDPARLSWLLLGSLIQAFGLCNIHAWSQVTEGGTLGLTLLLQHWTGLSPALTSVALNGVCFFIGWRQLGRRFLLRSAVGCAMYAVLYALLEPFAPLLPALIASPAVAAVSGACFIGVGAGLSVRAGAALSGDDAIAMVLSRRLRVGIQWIYLASDAAVLLLSLSYIPVTRIVWSAVTVVLSGQIIGLLQRLPLPGLNEEADA